MEEDIEALKRDLKEAYETLKSIAKPESMDPEEALYDCQTGAKYCFLYLEMKYKFLKENLD